MSAGGLLGAWTHLDSFFSSSLLHSATLLLATAVFSGTISPTLSFNFTVIHVTTSMKLLSVSRTGQLTLTMHSGRCRACFFYFLGGRRLASFYQSVVLRVLFHMVGGHRTDGHTEAWQIIREGHICHWCGTRLFGSWQRGEHLNSDFSSWRTAGAHCMMSLRDRRVWDSLPLDCGRKWRAAGIACNVFKLRFFSVLAVLPFFIVVICSHFSTWLIVSRCE